MDTITNSKISLAANLTTGGSKGVYQNVVQNGKYKKGKTGPLK
ncbi:hypothetical protein [Lactobacillus sp. ESL0677]|nr:hypothetical protein [Lactobacillus sp. ESL0677]WEV36714.1 hypothetical protein OZX76_08230 [Lactobacillus sp. ESL0677]